MQVSIFIDKNSIVLLIICLVVLDLLTHAKNAGLILDEVLTAFLCGFLTFLFLYNSANTLIMEH